LCQFLSWEKIWEGWKKIQNTKSDSQPNKLVPLPQAGFGGPHHSEKDVFVDDFKIPAGTDVYPDVAGILRNSTYWENSDDFLPERFIEGQTNKHWIPFQIGGRSCPGKVILYKVVLWDVFNSLTPNMSLIHTSFTYSKLNMYEICGLKFYLSYIHKSQKVLLKSLHAQRRSFLLLNLYF
jgi:hypothetical protein